MNDKQVSALAAAITATLGTAGVAEAATFTMTLNSVASYSGRQFSGQRLFFDCHVGV